MRDATKKQLTDLINALIEIRRNPELVDSFGGDFDFDTREFNSPNFKGEPEEKFDKIVNALKKVIEDKSLEGTSGNVRAIEDIKPDRENLKIKIIGSSTKNLEFYLTNRLDGKVKKRKYKPIPVAIPAGTKWEDIQIKFKDETEVTVKIGDEPDQTYDVDFADMGFSDTRKAKAGIMKPIKSWNFLCLLSMNQGKFSLGEISLVKEKRKNEKLKQELSSVLKGYFPTSIEGDPIEYDQGNETYQIKIKLTPESSLREQWGDRNIFQPKR